MQKQEVLIIKTGAAGDVVRTTTLLHLFKNHLITWVCSAYTKPLLKLPDWDQLSVLQIEFIPDDLFKKKFDTVISLEEDETCAKLASQVNTKQLTGVYWDGGIKYTNDSASLYEASVISRLSREKADLLKWNNQYTYQELLFTICGAEFKGEPYLIYQPVEVASIPGQIGIEMHAGQRWPNKKWSGYQHLIDILEKRGYTCYSFGRKQVLTEYLTDIRQCSYIISGDTLAMHIAIAYKIPCTALFNCTSPAEIYSYGYLNKQISPDLFRYFYKTTNDPAAQSSLSVEQVLESLLPHMELFSILPSNKG